MVLESHLFSVSQFQESCFVAEPFQAAKYTFLIYREVYDIFVIYLVIHLWEKSKMNLLRSRIRRFSKTMTENPHKASEV